MRAEPTGEGGSAGGGTRRVVGVSLVAASAQTAALAVAGIVTGPSAIVSRTFVTAADVAVEGSSSLFSDRHGALP